MCNMGLMHLLCMPASLLETGSRVPPRLHSRMAPDPSTAAWMSAWKSGFSSVPLNTPKKAKPARRANLRASQPACRAGVERL